MVVVRVWISAKKEKKKKIHGVEMAESLSYRFKVILLFLLFSLVANGRVV